MASFHNISLPYYQKKIFSCFSRNLPRTIVNNGTNGIIILDNLKNNILRAEIPKSNYGIKPLGYIWKRMCLPCGKEADKC